MREAGAGPVGKAGGGAALASLGRGVSIWRGGVKPLSCEEPRGPAGLCSDLGGTAGGSTSTGEREPARGAARSCPPFRVWQAGGASPPQPAPPQTKWSPGLPGASMPRSTWLLCEEEVEPGRGHAR